MLSCVTEVSLVTFTLSHHACDYIGYNRDLGTSVRDNTKDDATSMWTGKGLVSTNGWTALSPKQRLIAKLSESGEGHDKEIIQTKETIQMLGKELADVKKQIHIQAENLSGIGQNKEAFTRDQQIVSFVDETGIPLVNKDCSKANGGIKQHMNAIGMAESHSKEDLIDMVTAELSVMSMETSHEAVSNFDSLLSRK